MRKRVVRMRVQHPKEPELVQPAIQSVPYCLGKLRQGIADLTENLDGSREMSRVTRDLLFQEMSRCLVWLLRRVADGPRLHDPAEYFYLRIGEKLVRRHRWEGSFYQVQDWQVIATRNSPAEGWRQDVDSFATALDSIESVLATQRGLISRVHVRLHMEMWIQLKWLVSQAEIAQERRAYAATGALYAASLAEILALDVLHRNSQKKNSAAKKSIDQLQIRETISHSTTYNPAHHPVENDAGGVVVSSETVVNLPYIDPEEYRAFCGRPHFGRVDGNHVSMDVGEFDAFWEEASALAGRMAEETGVAVPEIREMIESGTAVPYLVAGQEGRALFLACGLRLDMADGNRWVILGMGAAETAWPDLDKFVRVARTAANDAGGLPVVIWGTSGLPEIAGFKAAEVPGLPGGVALVDRQAA